MSRSGSWMHVRCAGGDDDLDLVVAGVCDALVAAGRRILPAGQGDAMFLVREPGSAWVTVLTEFNAGDEAGRFVSAKVPGDVLVTLLNLSDMAWIEWWAGGVKVEHLQATFEDHMQQLLDGGWVPLPEGSAWETLIPDAGRLDELVELFTDDDFLAEEVLWNSLELFGIPTTQVDDDPNRPIIPVIHTIWSAHTNRTDASDQVA